MLVVWLGLDIMLGVVMDVWIELMVVGDGCCKMSCFCCGLRLGMLAKVILSGKCVSKFL